MFTKAYVAENGANTLFHIVKRLEATMPTEVLVVLVHSYRTQEEALAGTPPSWSSPVSVPIADLSMPLLDSIETWLATASPSPFAGGAVLQVQNTDLAAAKVKQWAAVKGARDVAIASGFDWDGSRFDSDLQSQIFIEGAGMMAMLAQQASQPIELEFTLADNSVRTLSATDVIAVGMAMGAHITTVHGIGRGLRTAIEAAETVADVEAIFWPASI
jgi:hypothetical protein